MWLLWLWAQVLMLSWQAFSLPTRLDCEILNSFKKGERAGGMAQWVKARADNPGNFGSQCPRDGERELTPSGCPLTSKCMRWHMSQIYKPNPNKRHKTFKSMSTFHLESHSHQQQPACEQACHLTLVLPWKTALFSFPRAPLLQPESTLLLFWNVYLRWSPFLLHHRLNSLQHRHKSPDIGTLKTLLFALFCFLSQMSHQIHIHSFNFSLIKFDQNLVSESPSTLLSCTSRQLSLWLSLLITCLSPSYWSPWQHLTHLSLPTRTPFLCPPDALLP